VKARQSRILIPETSVSRVPPANLKADEEKFFSHEYNRTFPAVHLWEIENARVSTEGVVFAGLKIFKPSLVNGSEIPQYHYRYLASNYFKRKKINLERGKKYLLCFNEWSMGYFHWMFEMLPRLMLVKENLNEYTLLLPEQYTLPFFENTLKAFRLQHIQIIPRNSYCYAPRLVMPEHAAPTGNYNETLMQKLRDQFLSFYSDNNLSLGDKIYISRKKANYRFILNEDEVIKTLEALGFKTVCFEDYSYGEAISIMQNTRYLVSIHGANLVNMMFMKPGSSVFQFITNGNSSDLVYYSLANAYGHKFYNQFCSYVNPRPGNYWNLTVDIDLLKRNMDQMLL